MEIAPYRRSSLESPTKLDRARVPKIFEGRWVLTLYPEAREAGGCFVSARSGATAGLLGEPGPDRAANEAARRARGHVRRYCAANGLNRLGTLTYGPPFCRDPLAVREHAGTFFRRLRKRTGPLAYVWVPELHADGERYHLHFAAGRYVHRGWIEEAWGHGFVWIHLLGHLPVGSGTIGEARAASRYLAKYIGKDLHASPVALHRYDLAQRFQPRKVRLLSDSLGEVVAKAEHAMGGPPEYLWDSAAETNWSGPHAVWLSWAG